jgi:hypothetical protein
VNHQNALMVLAITTRTFRDCIRASYPAVRAVSAPLHMYFIFC